MGAAALPPTAHLPPAAAAPAGTVDNPTPRPSSLPQLPFASPARPTPASDNPSSSLSCNQPISCVTETSRMRPYIRPHASFYALREGAGSSGDMKTRGDVADDEQQYEFAEKSRQEHRAINQVQAFNGSQKLASNDEHHEMGTEEDQLVQDSELMYGLRQNPKRSRRFADQDASSEEDTNMALRGNEADDQDANLIATVTRPVSVISYKKSMFTKLQEKAPAACTECGREFSSWKALFGHMRCHPEREWRGIQPPAEYSNMHRGPSKGKSYGNGDSKRYIIMKSLQPAIKHCSQRRIEHIKHFKPCKSPRDDAAMAMKLASEGDDSLLGCFKENHELQWSASRTQAMLEEEDESETESIEATYMSNQIEEEEGKSLNLSASLPRGKRSKRSHFTIKSLRSVQDQLAAEVSHDEKSKPAKKEDLEMATCLVMLAFAGSHTEISKQEAKGAALSKEEANLVDATDDDEGSIGNQLRLTWNRNNVCSTIEPRTFDGISNIDSNISSKDGALIVGDGEGGKYECTACKRIFKSHQALGGHRASHKKVKGCFAKTAGDADASPSYHKEGVSGVTDFLGTCMLSLAGSCSKDQSAAASYAPLEPLSMAELYRAGYCEDITGAISTSPGHDTKNAVVEGPVITTASNAAESGHLHLLLNGMDMAAASKSSKLALHNNSSKYHQCSICQRVFSSGQALGGHKRCHWAADKTSGNLAIAERGLMSVRSDMALGSGVPQTAVSAMACVATPASASKLRFFARSMIPEDVATHHVKALGIDLNLPAPPDQENDGIFKPKMSGAAQLGSLLSLGQTSSVTIHEAPISGFADEDALHRASDHASVMSVASSPSSTTSNVPNSESAGPC
ncbi:hypothetical protein L7F22_013375 [Adiantum nelumboides]|nr:hypothetical protein [Adiantum nelumboides]